MPGVPSPLLQAELTTQQTELIEKLNCLEFETSQLNRAYQLWRPYVEQGTAPDWMAAAIGITYDSLITFSIEVATILADVPPAFSAKPMARLEAGVSEVPVISGEECTTDYLTPRNTGAAREPRAEPSQELLPMTETEPDWSEPEMPAAIAPPSIDEQDQQEEESTIAHTELRTGAAWGTGAEPSPELLSMTETEPDWSGPEMPVAIAPPSSDEQGEQGQEQEDDVAAYSATHLAQLKAAAWGTPGHWEEESTTDHPEPRNTGAGRGPRTEPSPELLPTTETEPDWSGPEMPVAIAPPSTSDNISGQPAIQPGQQEDEAGPEPAALRSLATLAKWLQGSSTSILFFIPPGALRRIFRATFVAMLIATGVAIVIYLANTQRAARRSSIRPVQNSAAQPAAGGVAIPTGEKAEFKFAPDPIVAPLGRSFVINAVLSRGSDIASVAAQIDYDADLLKFMGVSEGGFLVRDGQQVVLAQRDDPLTGVLRVSAEKSPGAPGISGDGSVFALSFQARKRGKAMVSIIPGAHDSQGRRIEMAGSQVSVRVN